MDPQEIFTHPFTLGLALGLVFTVIALWNLWRSRSQMRHYKRHLSDKLEIEADAITKTRREAEALRREAETLRMKVSAVNESANGRSARDLEVYARAERQMLVSVPGFAPAWESAKASAISELEAEEAGRSLPKRVFTKLFGARPDGDSGEDGAHSMRSLPSTEK